MHTGFHWILVLKLLAYLIHIRFDSSSSSSIVVANILIFDYFVVACNSIKIDVTMYIASFLALLSTEICSSTNLVTVFEVMDIPIHVLQFHGDCSRNMRNTDSDSLPGPIWNTLPNPTSSLYGISFSFRILFFTLVVNIFLDQHSRHSDLLLIVPCTIPKTLSVNSIYQLRPNTSIHKVVKFCFRF